MKRADAVAKERHAKLMAQVEKRNIRRHPVAPPPAAKSLSAIRENPAGPGRSPMRRIEEKRRIDEERIREILEERKLSRINHEALRLHAKVVTRQAKADEDRRVHQINLMKAKLPPPVPVVGKASLLAERRAQYANLVRNMTVVSPQKLPQRRRVVVMGLEPPRAPKTALQLAAEKKANEYLSLRRGAINS